MWASASRVTHAPPHFEVTIMPWVLYIKVRMTYVLNRGRNLKQLCACVQIVDATSKHAIRVTKIMFL